MAHVKKSTHKAGFWTAVFGIITIFGIIIAAVNDSFGVWDRLFTFKPTQTPALTGTPFQLASNANTSDYLPLSIDSTRTYNVIGSVPNGGFPDNQIMGNYTEKVIKIENRRNENISIYQVELTGGAIYDGDCSALKVNDLTIEKWYITDNTHLYVGCSQDRTDEIVKDLINQFYSNAATPIRVDFSPVITFPLKVNNKWNGIQEIPADLLPMIKWYVEEKLQYTVPAGTFNDCYRIVLYEASDVLIRYFCNGVGTVAMEYHNHNKPIDFRVELTSYSKTSNP